MAQQTEPVSADVFGLPDAGTVLAGGFWTSITAIVPPLQTFLISIVAARFLGATDFGRQSVIAFIGLSVGTVFAARMPAALSRFGAELIGSGDLGALHWMFRWVLKVQAWTAVAIVIGYGVAAAAGAVPRTAWIVAGAATALAVMQSAMSALLVAAQRWRQSILPGTVTTVVATAAMIPVLALGGGIPGYFEVEAGLVVANLAWTWHLVRPVVAALPEPRPIAPGLRRDFRSFMQTSTFFALVEFVVLSRVEILFLDHYGAATQVAFYSVAYAASAAVARFPAVITTVAMPTVATLHGAGEHARIRVGYWRALRLLAAITPILVALAATLGADLLGIAYGSRFNAAEPVLVILIVPYVIVPMMGMSEALLWTFRRMRFLVVSGTAAMVVDIALAFWLIPTLHAIGAGIVNDVAVLVSGAPTLWVACRMMAPVDVNWNSITRSVALATAAAGLTVGITLTLSGLPGFFAALGAVILFLWIVGGRVGLLDRADARWLATVLGSRFGGRLVVVVRHFSD